MWKKRIILRLQAMFVREIISTSKRYSYMELKRMKLKKIPNGGACMGRESGLERYILSEKISHVGGRPFM
ncbi:hypothetical protein DOZ91_02590 [Peribacillus frigoritolerans]|nr:hypothetical protein DOZ91_02590 [Peribacillus frigoritolerans]